MVHVALHVHDNDIVSGPVRVAVCPLEGTALLKATCILLDSSCVWEEFVGKNTARQVCTIQQFKTDIVQGVSGHYDDGACDMRCLK